MDKRESKRDPKEVRNLTNFNNWLYDNDIFYKIDKGDIYHLYTNLWGYIVRGGYMKEIFGHEDLITKSIDLNKIVKILNFSPNIEYIKSTISEETNNNYDKYCNYIKEYVELYKNIKKDTRKPQKIDMSCPNIDSKTEVDSPLSKHSRGDGSDSSQLSPGSSEIFLVSCIGF
ncbi:hypothetical protein POVCU2_0060170 [Plasmodium ovale curtisi]|uniref:PIR Superfamily Protein n=1 Tax=Plasmodium ovale curtisi TaxID=864141 RepID=A0A1A8WBJ3_PLAOA|nr:hypothetical protein POVCU2_0060170 [Plasmodium ovale curtisi]